MTAYALTESHRELFDALRSRPIGFDDLTAQLNALEGEGTPLQIVGRLTESGLLQGYDKTGEPVRPRAALRFGGVGSEDDLS